MSRDQITTAIKKLQTLFNIDELNKLGKEPRFCHKLRKFTPGKLALSLITAFSATSITSIADLHRTFNELIEEDSEYKPFHNQLSKKEFPNFMMSVLNQLLSELYVNAIELPEKSPLKQFKKIFCHDGSTLALKNGLATIFPGRFTNTMPAAIELHVTLDLLSGQPEQVIMTEDTASERYQLLPVKEQENCLALYDRAYCDRALFKEYNEHNASFIIKGKKSLKPVVKNAYINGKRYKKLIGKQLDFKKKLPKQGIVDCDVTWPSKKKDKHGQTIVDEVYRMLFWWNATTKEYIILMTNLSRKMFSPFDIMTAYRLRWQIELLFKEWKSFCQLKKFDTNNQHIAAGLIWTAIIASVIKRYLSGVTQLHYQVWMSTLTVAKCIGNKLFSFFEKIIQGSKRAASDVIHQTCEYLFKNAARAHPKRDANKSGWNLGFTISEINSALKY